ncbi:MAG: CYTH domain-containing protein [Oscillospiraceae bacterium]|nr:CYTH domain-containing protein [Oscillospiraceae bacterium]
MELEYKWQFPQDTMQALAEYLHGLPGSLPQETLHMEAEYYDSPERFAYKTGAALRLRRENSRTVCCLKQTVQKEGAKALREEYETEAETVAEGLKKLPAAGAPAELCLALSLQPLAVFARTQFIRNCRMLSPDGTFTAEFAVDAGHLGNPKRMLPFEELELEFKSGDAAAFQQFAEDLQKRFALVPQPLSKLARAAAAQ